METRNDCKYDLLAPTSMGVRITPLDRQPVHTSNLFCMQATSAESNVLSISASLGLSTKVLTVFVKDSPVARFIKDDLRSRGIVYEGQDVSQDGPWGYRHQFNIADSGFGPRAPRVYNDRAGEIGRSLSAAAFDLDRIFGREGVRIMHLSGLVAALSPETSEFCLQLARAAKKYGVQISFDLNYRASFWEGKKELAAAFHELAALSDVLIGNEEDFQLCLGIAGPETGGKDLSAKIRDFQGMIDQASKKYPNVRVFATTLRQVISANEHLWGAILRADTWHVVEPRPIAVLDRIGGGDGFTGGLLYGILRNWTPEKWVQFGWACGALVVTMQQDYALPVDEKQVWSLYEGNARVVR